MLRVLLVIEDYSELTYLQTILRKIGFDVEGLNNQKKYMDASLGFNPQVVVATAKGKKVDVVQLAPGIRKYRGYPKIVALKAPNVQLDISQKEALGIDLVADSPVNMKKLVAGIAELAGIDDAKFLEKLDKLNASGGAEESEESSQSFDTLDDLGDELIHIKAQKEMEEIIGSDGGTDSGEGAQATDTADELRSHGVSGAPEKVTVSEKPEESEVNEGASAPKADLLEESGEILSEELHRLVETVSPEEAETRRNRFDSFLKVMEKPEPGQFKRDRILEFNKKIRSLGTVEDIEDVEDERRRFVRSLFKDKK